MWKSRHDCKKKVFRSIPEFLMPVGSRLVCIPLFIGALAFLTARTTAGQEKSFDAVQYIARAILDNPIVCLAEGGHASKTSHDFLKTMFMDKDVQNAVDVVIVEFATARYQALMDEYMNGKDVPFAELSRLWRDTTVSSMVTTWDSPLYYELLKHIRTINQSLDPGKKIRVMGGDPPIKWEEIKSREDHRAYFRQRNSFPAELAVDQAVNFNKKVLIIFGGAHLAKVPANLRGRINKGLTNIIQEKQSDSVLSISFLIPKDLKVEDRMPELQRGRIYETGTHWSGELPANLLFPMLFHLDGSKAEPYEGRKIKDLYDALIYIGPLTEWVFAPPEVYQDDDYWAELNRRSQIVLNRPMDEKLRSRR